MDLIKDNIPEIRFLYDMKDFLYDQQWLSSAPNFEVYYMYRNLAKNEKDKKIIAEKKLRYDITVMPPQMLGAEFPKTIGHEHPKINNSPFTYTEIYEVLKGEAHYLLQKFENNQVIDVYVVKTKAGEKCLVPPNYGHVTINASDQELMMANWVSADFKSDYSLFQQKHGACYYALATDNRRKIQWVENKNYKQSSELKIYNAQDFNYLFERFDLDTTNPLYDLVNEINKLNFLQNPQVYKWD